MTDTVNEWMGLQETFSIQQKANSSFKLNQSNCKVNWSRFFAFSSEGNNQPSLHLFLLKRYTEIKERDCHASERKRERENG